MSKMYTATASCDWGGIYYNRPIEAGSWHGAFAKAGKLARAEARRRPKQITLSLSYVGTKEKLEKSEE